MAEPATLETIWEVDDTLWAIVEPILTKKYPAKGNGRSRVGFRQVLNAISYRMRNGCQWNHMPAELGSDSSNHRWMPQWREDGVLEQEWAKLAEACDELGGVDWDCGSRPTRYSARRAWGRCRSQPDGSDEKRHEEERARRCPGRPARRDDRSGQLADAKCLEDLLHSVVVERTESVERLCLDKGYDNPTARQAAEAFGYKLVIEPIRRPAKPKPKRQKNRRWAVELTFAWLSKCHALLVRNEKNPLNYLAFFQLGCLLLWYRRLHRITARSGSAIVTKRALRSRPMRACHLSRRGLSKTASVRHDAATWSLPESAAVASTAVSKAGREPAAVSPSLGHLSDLAASSTR